MKTKEKEITAIINNMLKNFDFNLYKELKQFMNYKLPVYPNVESFYSEAGNILDEMYKYSVEREKLKKYLISNINKIPSEQKNIHDKEKMNILCQLEIIIDQMLGNEMFNFIKKMYENMYTMKKELIKCRKMYTANKITATELKLLLKKSNGKIHTIISKNRNRDLECIELSELFNEVLSEINKTEKCLLEKIISNELKDSFENFKEVFNIEKIETVIKFNNSPEINFSKFFKDNLELFKNYDTPKAFNDALFITYLSTKKEIDKYKLNGDQDNFDISIIEGIEFFKKVEQVLLITKSKHTEYKKQTNIKRVAAFKEVIDKIRNREIKKITEIEEITEYKVNVLDNLCSTLEGKYEYIDEKIVKNLQITISNKTAYKKTLEMILRYFECYNKESDILEIDHVKKIIVQKMPILAFLAIDKNNIVVNLFTKQLYEEIIEVNNILKLIPLKTSEKFFEFMQENLENEEIKIITKFLRVQGVISLQSTADYSLPKLPKFNKKNNAIYKENDYYGSSKITSENIEEIVTYFKSQNIMLTLETYEAAIKCWHVINILSNKENTCSNLHIEEVYRSLIKK